MHRASRVDMAGWSQSTDLTTQHFVLHWAPVLSFRPKAAYPTAPPKSGHPQTQIWPQYLLGCNLSGVAHGVQEALFAPVAPSHTELLAIPYTFTLFSVPRSHQPLCLERHPPHVLASTWFTQSFSSLGTFQDSPPPFSQVWCCCDVLPGCPLNLFLSSRWPSGILMFSSCVSESRDRVLFPSIPHKLHC